MALVRRRRRRQRALEVGEHLLEPLKRTFRRRFLRATGMTPLDYVHTLGLEMAKQMLETGGLPVESVAMEVGHQNASVLGRLSKRKVAPMLAQYRRRFDALDGQLRRVATPR